MARARRGAWSARAEVALAVLAYTVAGTALGGPVLGVVALWVAVSLIVVGRPTWTVGLLRGAVVLVGWVIIVAALDWGAGTAWNRATGTPTGVPTASSDVVVDIADVDLPRATDRRGDGPAYDGVPWAERYFQELDALVYEYVPFLGPRVASVHSRYINSSDGIRRTYEPEPPPGVEPIEVWFFGGSTTWGEGQRDLYTIPSQVARIAEEHGVHLHAVNMGERGYNAYQEFLLLQNRLDELGPPDLAVFFDGINETGTQLEPEPSPIDQPAIYQYASTRDVFERVPPLPDVSSAVEPSIRDDYLEVSLVNKLLRRLGGLATITPAEAQEPPPPLTEDQVHTLLGVYARSVDLAAMVARRHDVPVVRFWQPVEAGTVTHVEPGDLPPEVHDLSGAYDVVADQDTIFIDGGHTNEVGSRIAAEAMWPQLQLALERLGIDR